MEQIAESINDINEKDISFKEIRENSKIQGDREYTFTKRKLEIFYKGGSTNRFWELMSEIDGIANDPYDLYKIDMELIKADIIYNYLGIK